MAQSTHCAGAAASCLQPLLTSHETRSCASAARVFELAELPVAAAVEELELLLVQRRQRGPLRHRDHRDAQRRRVLVQAALHVDARGVGALVQHRQRRPALRPNTRTAFPPLQNVNVGAQRAGGAHF